MSHLIAFIESHDGCKVEQCLAGRLIVSSLVVDAAGRVHRISETIPANLRAARDWLGY